MTTTIQMTDVRLAVTNLRAHKAARTVRWTRKLQEHLVEMEALLADGVDFTPKTY